MFENAEIIDAYTRAQALADGALIAVPRATAEEAGLLYPVALTDAVWADCVTWTDTDTRFTGMPQDEDGRLWDVLYMTMVAIDRARRRVSKVTLSDGQVASIDSDDLALIGQYTWHYDHGYASTTVGGRGRQRKIYMHQVILPVPDGYEVDHRDGDRLNNQRGNLRIVTHSQNAMNSRLRSDSTSGFRGVSWESQTGRWRARIRADGRDLSIGRFTSRESANRAYVEAANSLHGDYARRAARDADRVVVRMVRVSRDDRPVDEDDYEPPEVRLLAVIGPGDQGEPVITIQQPGED